jgi:hypothetical protein
MLGDSGGDAARRQALTAGAFDYLRKRLAQTSMVVEVTPHYRAQYKPTWTYDFFRQ